MAYFYDATPEASRIADHARVGPIRVIEIDVDATSSDDQLQDLGSFERHLDRERRRRARDDRAPIRPRAIRPNLEYDGAVAGADLVVDPRNGVELRAASGDVDAQPRLRVDAEPFRIDLAPEPNRIAI